MSIAELTGARQLAKEDPSLYPDFVKGFLNIADRPEVNLRRFVAAFLVDAFSATEVAFDTKQKLAVESIDTLTTLAADTDYSVLKGAITCLSLVYPLIFDYVVTRPMEGPLWDKVAALKNRAFQLWDGQHAGVQAACIKFGQVAALVQTKSRDGPSILNIPQGHPVLDTIMLEAEGAGLIDRLLGYFTGRDLDVPVFCATLNASLPLAFARPPLAPRIIQAVLSFDSSRKRLSCEAGADELAIKFVEKTLKLELESVARQGLVPSLNPAIQRYLSKIAESRASASLRKRAADLADSPNAKRVRIGSADMPVVTTTKLPAGAVPLAQLYSLVDADNDLAKFSARDLTLDVAVAMALSSLQNVNPPLLTNCLDIVGRRYSSIPEAGRTVRHPANDSDDGAIPAAPQGVPAAAAEAAAAAAAAAAPSSVASPEPFSMDRPPKYDAKESALQATRLMERLIAAGEQAPESEVPSSSLDRHILSKWSNNSWIYLAARAAARGAPGDSPVSKAIRESLYDYVLADFRGRLSAAVTWLSEEWYAETVLKESSEETTSTYFDLVSRIIDQILPRLEVADSKTFIRLVSEIPALNREIIFKLKSLCIDPERAPLAFRALKFLIMFKPPAKEDCLDLVQELYNEGIGGTEPILKRYRPEAVKPAEAEPEAVA